jgi:hypothetical protein
MGNENGIYDENPLFATDLVFLLLFRAEFLPSKRRIILWNRTDSLIETSAPVSKCVDFYILEFLFHWPGVIYHDHVHDIDPYI